MKRKHQSWPLIQHSGCWAGTAESERRSTACSFTADLSLLFRSTRPIFGSELGLAWSDAPVPISNQPRRPLGAALNNPLTEAAGHDLARELRPCPDSRDFPWAELVLQGALVGGVSLFLSGAAADVETRYRSARAEAAAFTWLKDQNQGKLDTEKRLSRSGSVFEAFLQTRMGWSSNSGRSPPTPPIPRSSPH